MVNKRGGMHLLEYNSFLYIAMTVSQTRQCNAIIRRCAKGHRDVQDAAGAAEKNATIFIW